MKPVSIDYYAQEAKTELEKRKHEAEVLYEAWSKVERKYTKSGEPYKVMSHNYANAYVGASVYDSKDKQIKVSTSDDRNHYFDDWIAITKTVERDEEEKYKDRVIERGTWLKPYVELNCDEIDELIAKRMEYYDKMIADLDKVLADWEQVAGKLIELREQAEQVLKAQPSCAYYALRNIVREQRS